MDDDENPRIISLVSRVLTKYESRYTTTEKELLAIVYAILKFPYYLIGTEFDVITDHKSLTFLLSSPFHNARLIRWILSLQEYNFNIHHCKGVDNLVADVFSRHFANQSSVSHSNYLILNCVRELLETKEESADSARLVAQITMKGDFIREVRDLASHQSQDASIQKLKNRSNDKLTFLSENNVLYVKPAKDKDWRLLLPRTLIEMVIKTAHEQFGHAGAFKLFAYLNQYFFLAKNACRYQGIY